MFYVYSFIDSTIPGRLHNTHFIAMPNNSPWKYYLLNMFCE